MANNDAPLIKWLENSGFENIQLHEGGDTLILSYENRVFRHEADAIAYLIQNMPLPENAIIILLPQYLNIPMLSIVLKSDLLKLYRQRKIGSRDLINNISLNLNTDFHHPKTEDYKEINPSFLKADISLEPIISMQLGNFDRPIQLLAEIAPNLQIQLAKGLALNAQLLIPVYNNLKSMEGVPIRAGMITLSQNVRLPDDFFITATAGIFSYDRLGIDLKTKKYFFNGRLGIYSQMGYTTWSKTSNDFESRYYDRDNYFIGRMGAEYRITDYDLLFSASYGSYLYQDKGWRFDILRQFGELIIGFVGIITTDNYNAGFYVRVPLAPAKYAKIKRIRIRPSSSFNWGYRFRGQTHTGKIYNSGENILTKTREFNPHFIKNQLMILLK